jgi:tetratricopeptide (TPR) repeat protein
MRTRLLKTQSRYPRNLSLIRNRFPHLCGKLQKTPPALPFRYEPTADKTNVFFISPQGSRIPYFDDPEFSTLLTDLNSGVDPIDFVFIVGIGLGRLPMKIIETLNPSPTIVILEPNQDLLHLAMLEADLTSLLNHHRIYLYEGDGRDIQSIIDQFKLPLAVGNIKSIAIHAPSPQYRTRSLQSATRLGESLQTLKEAWFTAKTHGKQMLLNSIDNLPSVLASPSLSHLKNKFSGIPAFCVAAGPSLDQAMDQLKKIGDRALIISVDSAVKILLENGIRPHMMATVDFKPLNFEKIRSSLHLLDQTALIFAPEAHPRCVRLFPCPRRLAVTATGSWIGQWLGSAFDFDSHVPRMGSVSHAAAHTAVALGADPIVLVGMDMAYPNNIGHSSGAVFKDNTQRQGMKEVAGVSGRPVLSRPALIADKVYFESVIASAPATFIQTSLQGAFIEGARIKSIDEIIDTTFHDNVNVRRCLDSIDWKFPADIQTKAKVTKSLQNSIEGFLKDVQFHRKRVADTKMPFDNNQPNALHPKNKTIQSKYNECCRIHARIIRMIEPLRLEEIEKAAKDNKIRKQESNSEKNGNINHNAVDSIIEAYQSFDTAGILFLENYSKITQYFQDLSSFQQPHPNGPADFKGQMDRAKIHLRHGQVWKAAPLYLECHRMDRKQMGMGMLIALAEAYFRTGMWLHFRWLWDYILKNPHETDAIQKLATDRQHAIDQQTSEIRKAIENGNPDEASRLASALNLLEPEVVSALGNPNNHLSHNSHIPSDNQNLSPVSDFSRQKMEKLSSMIEQGKLEAAIGILEHLSITNSDQALGYHELIGDIRLQQKDPAAAFWHYQKCLQMGATHDELNRKLQLPQITLWRCQSQIALARALHLEGKSQEAISMLMKTVKEFPAGGKPFFDAARILIEMEQWDQAIQLLEALPDAIDPLTRSILLAQCHHTAGDSLASDHYMETASALSPSDPRVTAFKAQKIADERQIQKAEGLLSTALLLHPKNADLIEALSKIKWQLEKIDEASELMEKGVCAAPDDQALIGIYHQAVLETHRYKSAEAVFQFALSRNHRHKKLRYLLVDVLLRQQKDLPAMREIEGMLAEFPIEEGLLQAALGVRQKLPKVKPLQPADGFPTCTVLIIAENAGSRLCQMMWDAKFIADDLIVILRQDDSAADWVEAFGARSIIVPEKGVSWKTIGEFDRLIQTDWCLVLYSEEWLAPFDWNRIKAHLKTSKPQPQAAAVQIFRSEGIIEPQARLFPKSEFGKIAALTGKPVNGKSDDIVTIDIHVMVQK